MKATSTAAEVPVSDSSDSPAAVSLRRWTWKTKAPEIGSESAEIARQATVYVPGASVPRIPVETIGPDEGVTWPVSTRRAFSSKTRIPPSDVSTVSSKRSTTRSGDFSTTTSFPGSVETRRE